MTTPYLQLEWVHPELGCRGHLVIDRLVRGVSAGGLRMRAGIDRAEVTALSRNMTLKQAAVGIQVGGAKAGLDLDPASPARREALIGFLRALRPIIAEQWAVGPDMNTTMAEIEGIGREVGLPCLKIAVGRSNGIPDEVFLRRYTLLEAPSGVYGHTVNQLRAGQGVAAAAEVLLARAARGGGRPRVAIQGAGGLGAGTALLVHQGGASVVAWADDRRCLQDAAGLDVPALAARIERGRLPADGNGRDRDGRSGASRDVLTAPCDVLILAAISDAIPIDLVSGLACRGVVVGANLGLSDATGEALHAAGVAVVPDLLASAGGSLAIEALCESDPDGGEAILAHVRNRTTDVVRRTLDESEQTGRSPTALVRARLCTWL